MAGFGRAKKTHRINKMIRTIIAMNKTIMEYNVSIQGYLEKQ